MKLVIGLGNPEGKYGNNRHNVGHMFVEFSISNFQFPINSQTNNFQFLKTDCFMNESGKFVQKWTDFYKVNPGDLYVVHDDLDIPFGQYKIQLGVGPKVHYGVNSVEENLGAKNFWRVRIGVDHRDPNNRISGDEYVLQDFTAEEKKELAEIFVKIAGELFK